MKERKSNLELLRIVAILMVLTVHYLLHMRYSQGSDISLYYNKSNYNLMCILESFCIIGVNLFILITGYFMINKNKVNINKVVKLIFSCSFYSIVFLAIAVKMNITDFSIKELIKASISFLTCESYWFIKLYCVLFCLIPFINMGLNKMNKNTYRSLIIILFIIFPISTSFLPYFFSSGQGYDIVHFVFMYCIGGYLRLHFDSKGKFKWLFGYIICSSITSILSIHPFPPYKVIYEIWGYDYIFNILSAICLFIFFTKINIQSKFINIISSTVLGVYLIHGNDFVTPIIYKNVGLYWDSNMLIFNLVIRIVVVFCVCSLIELIKEFIFNKTIYKFIDKFKIFNIYLGE